MLTNGPTIGIKALRAADWHLALPMSLSGIGLFLTLALSVWMARRPKLPFILVPGFTSCAACLGMALAPDPLAFLFLLGLFNLLDSISRPALAVIIRLNYPAESRGWVTGRLRRWSAGTFLLSALATAWVLDRAGTWPVIQAALVTAAVLQTLAHLAFSRIRVRPEPRGDADADAFARGGRSALVGALAAVWGDRRFVRYLWGSVVFQLGNLMYNPIVRPFLSAELHFNYTQCRLHRGRPAEHVLAGDDPPPGRLARPDEPADRLEPDPAWLGHRPAAARPVAHLAGGLHGDRRDGADCSAAA